MVGEVSPLELCCNSAVPGLGSLGRTNNTLDLLGNCTQPMEQYGADLRAMFHIHTVLRYSLDQGLFSELCRNLPLIRVNVHLRFTWISEKFHYITILMKYH